jgi:hypothetical protein
MRMKLIITTLLVLMVALSTMTHRRVAAQPIDGKLGWNIPGANWTGAGDLGKVDILVDDVRDSGARWIFLTVIWSTFEANSPTPGACPRPNFAADGVSMYYYRAPSNQCHAYNLREVQVLDRLTSGLKGNGHDIAMGIFSPPTWAGNAPCAGVGARGQEGCAIVYRDHLGTFSDGARDLANFLADRYTPAAYSVWNEPNGFRYLSIEPDYSRTYTFGSPVKTGWRAWEDYYTYLLAPISDDLQPRGILIMGPELATGGQRYGVPATDPNWNNISVGHWNDQWNDYLMSDGRAAKVNKWTIHSYGDRWQETPWNSVNWTWNKMVSKEAQHFIWVTEANMDKRYKPANPPWSGPSGTTQRQLADYFCNINRAQAHERTFFFGGDEETDPVDYGNPDSLGGLGLVGSVGHDYEPKWLLLAFYSILAGSYYCG